MPETIIESVLTGKFDSDLLLKWLKDENDTPGDSVIYCCNRNEFVAYFLSYLRSQTSSILQTNNSTLPPLHQTPEKVHNARRKHRRSISDPTSDDRKDCLSVKSQTQRSHESPSKDRKKTGRRVKTKLFPEDKNLSVSSDESRLSLGMERIAISSTPIKNGLKFSDYPNLASPVSPKSFRENERCDTPRLTHRHRSHEKSCLGDYMVNVQKSSKKKKGGKNASDDSETRIELDLSNSDIFPEIGARKASSLRSEKRRIKPTNIDKSTSRKSLSLNSFNSDCFQQPSPLALEDNAAFKQQQNVQPKESASSFDAERSMLKLERHKLMEKFNILNTSSSPKPPTPTIKITQKESFEKSQNFVKPDVTKILLKEKLDFLVDIYEVLLNTNLILSVNTEIYFLITILLSVQYEDDYNDVESNLNDKNLNFLLKSIHNCTYFAVRSLWNMRGILEVILDKNSLKILGENKKVRSFCPDLAKFLLNSYGLKCELENNQDKKNLSSNRCSNGVICFNHETDNVDNFPSVLSFQNFKKQRDMFYEILRWYQEHQSTGCSRTTFRARIKTLLSCGVSPANYAHLAALFMQHMVAECLPANVQESKLSKLHRRLTCPNAPESHRLPNFSAKETFYKEFIMYTENEPFRIHLRDALCSEITILNSTPIAVEDRGSSNNSDTSKEYHNLAKKLSLLSKFLGFLTSLPYTYIPEPSSKNIVVPREVATHYMPPKDKVLENNIALRNNIQPAIDLKGILLNAYEHSRLTITVPWIVHYLSMLDYTSLRTKYYQDLLKTLHHVYIHRLKMNQNLLKKNTVIFLKSVLGWLFDLPHYPQHIFCDSVSVVSEINLDCYDVIDEVILFDLCPYLRDVNVLLSTCKVSNDQKDIGSFRHITPVSLSLNPEDRMRNKERELQARLEEEMLKSQPSSSRRVVEMVTERVAAATVRDLNVTLASVRDSARARAATLVKERGHIGQPALLQSLQSLYNEQLQHLRSTAIETSKATIKRRINSALQALLPSAPLPLQALAANNCLNRLHRWIDDHWNSSAILCKDIEGEMKNLIAIGEACLSPKPTVCMDALIAPDHEFEANNISPTTCIINLKEQICLLLDDEEPSELIPTLASCALCCSPNNLFSRPPTQRVILQLSVDLCIVYVSRKPREVTEDFLNTLQAIWNTCCPDRKRNEPEEILLPERRPELSPEFRNFEEDERFPTPVSDDEDGSKVVKIRVVTNFKIAIDKSVASDKSVESVNTDKNVTNAEEHSDEYLEFFDRVLCPRNIVLLSSTKSKQSEVWEALAIVLVFLLKNDYLSEDSLTEQCLAVYRQDWPQNILENLSNCMKSVSSRWSRSSTGKFTLFLDFLAEYCGDMDYEPVPMD
ncbi:unnamed protein product [Diatraea saccharalis]|uniref:Codanin-1 C-terminal domain-containing protein n=1 Tax=Diatraea saccharalis TaxID=40085 RepID=A0A9P0C6C7_9NEOP|nr:unnamed protein product [Diatraea saccharalis]